MYKVPLNENWGFFTGRELTQLCIGLYDIQLHFNDGLSISIHSGDPGSSFNHKTKLVSSSEVKGMPGGAVTLVSLLGAIVQRVVSENDTTLFIKFNNEEELRIYDGSETYESFVIDGPTGVIVI